MQALTNQSEWQAFLESLAGRENLCARATEEQLLKAETKLKLKLPPSYRTFLSASNGLKQASRAVSVLKPVEKLKWFGREHRDWVQAYVSPMQGMELPLPAEQDYFNYAGEDRGSFDTKHLAQTLCISEVGDSAVLLLNPMVVWPDGEWEVWFFANWIPGAMRYRSFAEWMRHELAERRNEPYETVQPTGELPTVYLNGPAKVNRRIRPREEVLTLEQVRDRLRSKTRSRRVKAVQHLSRMRGAEAVSLLLELFQNDYDFHVRCEAAESLGKLQSPKAIEPLIAAASEYSHVSSSAIRGLSYYNDERSARCLVELIETDNLSAGVAVHALAARQDARAVKPLVDLLTSKNLSYQGTGRIAGRFIAQFEADGLAALSPLMNSEDDEIRERALLGISDLASLSKSKELRMRACKLMEECLAREKSAALRQHMAISIEVSSKKKPQIGDNPFTPE
jgi:hypothetical protein